MKIIAIEARNVCNADEEKIGQLLDEGWQNAEKAAKEYGNAQSHPYIKPWGERMKAVGAPRKKFPCSLEAMVRRAGKGGEPFRINPVVDFYNGISMKYLVPAGAYDIDQMDGDMELRFSREGDTFTALDSGETMELQPGEVSYTDGNTIITRHFVYKQSKHALLTPESKNILFVSEILGDLPEETADIVTAALEEGLRECFDADFETVILDENRTCMK